MPGKGWYLSVGNAFFPLLHSTGDPASLHWAQQQPGCGYVFLDERQIHPHTLLASIKDRARSLNHGALSRSRLEQLSDLSIKIPTGYSTLSLARLRVGRQSKVIYGWHQPMYLCAHLVYATSFSAQPASISHHFCCEEFPPNNLNLPFFLFFFSLHLLSLVLLADKESFPIFLVGPLQVMDESLLHGLKYCIPSMMCSYFSLKHSVVPQLGAGIWCPV